ncbi:serine/threonine protein kinase [Golden Marseillevirus]|uniref:serine/threonine protein kinase n=1 Tax=Golden Marseillevirus TaxID=1720526 RepID=UPI000877ABF3|nr:serine/threonine protein kinase [Golden Marseillevirus]ALX27492.1 serine/threonine protein kinase [Golden Marseillevirus]
MKTFFPDRICDYKKKYLIGSGSESQVWCYKKQKKLYALKYNAKDPHLPQHKNICTVFEILEYQNHSWTVMEYLGSLSLFEVSTSHRVDKETCMFWFRQLCHCLDYVHSFGIAHCDIKCENIMVHMNTPKLIDWGFSERQDSQNKKGAKGSFEYCAPEIFGEDAEKRDLFACDVWSMGVVLHCMLTSCFPFYGRNEEELLQCIKEKKSLLKIKDKEEREFFLWLFERKPRKRPTFKQILEHPFVMGQYQSIPSEKKPEEKKSTKKTPLIKKDAVIQPKPKGQVSP